MNNNLWMYANEHTQTQIAGSLIAFGAENFKRAKVIQEISTLRHINNLVQKNIPYDVIGFSQEFIHEYLIDCVRILIFFENYMKAELILKGYCIHNISSSSETFRALRKKQHKEPITLKEIEDIYPFEVEVDKEIIRHKHISEITIGNNVLINSSEYTKHFHFSNSITSHIKELTATRNKLHLIQEAHFEISTGFIKNLVELNDFVDTTIKRLVE